MRWEQEEENKREKQKVSKEWVRELEFVQLVCVKSIKINLYFNKENKDCNLT